MNHENVTEILKDADKAKGPCELHGYMCEFRSNEDLYTSRDVEFAKEHFLRLEKTFQEKHIKHRVFLNGSEDHVGSMLPISSPRSLEIDEKLVGEIRNFIAYGTTAPSFLQRLKKAWITLRGK